ncbi:MarR family EPS-associated transcriptional regulator [Novosphingobium album (ex Liu et al. 2023)]|uniref:MarR family EPS-associated transcriptional regulator n=1 Tax=Novosphingobium album (ex Liu et al. 2023) TaxID=3031130 RepID=A0ABT5WT42_9SPHN|nr:MarR family EPS-associated transcriptional regulator [Novosphingobium album (ex Liu et al. 2023)]MDE8653006.1 MarR family EPS-associated transcriptional regulator [Novosphingobium album (ex Liu et al. 2023)]
MSKATFQQLEMPNRLTDEAREDVHFRIMRLIAEHPNLSQRQMANELGISLGRINYCLKGLIEKGLVRIENFRASKSKLHYIHVLTPNGIAERGKLTANFLKRRLAEYDALAREISDLRGQATVGDDEARR